jgi:hypothetical protein
MPAPDESFVTPVHPLGEIEAKSPLPNGALSQTPRSPEFQVLPEIDNTNRNFKGQQRNEMVHCFCRKHWIVLVPHLIGFLFLVVLPLIFLLFISSETLAGLMSPLAYRIIAGVAASSGTTRRVRR